MLHPTTSCFLPGYYIKFMKVESKQTIGSLEIEETMLSRETEATSRCKAEYPKSELYWKSAPEICIGGL